MLGFALVDRASRVIVTLFWVPCCSARAAPLMLIEVYSVSYAALRATKGLLRAGPIW